MDQSAPVLLNALRVCDVPEALGMLAPRQVTLLIKQPEEFQKTTTIYRLLVQARN